MMCVRTIIFSSAEDQPILTLSVMAAFRKDCAKGHRFTVLFLLLIGTQPCTIVIMLTRRKRLNMS